MKHLIHATAAALIAANSIANAHDIAEVAEVSPWVWSISGGVTVWENLGNIESRSGGTFDDVGFGLEAAGHKRVSQWGSTEVLLGVDLGFFTAQSNIRGRVGDLAQRGLYLTPSVKLGLGERSRFFVEAGAGWYNVDFAEINCYTIYAYCEEVDAPFDANALGAYLGFRAQLGRVVFLSFRAHHADFGEVSGIDAVPARLEGPFYSLSVGAAF